MLVIEGLLPFVNPRGFQRAMALMASQPERAVRLSGLVSMLIGAAALQLLR